jgi:hypothetical protein
MLQSIKFLTDKSNVYGPYGGSGGFSYPTITLSHPNCILSYVSGYTGDLVDNLVFSFGCP